MSAKRFSSVRSILFGSRAVLGVALLSVACSGGGKKSDDGTGGQAGSPDGTGGNATGGSGGSAGGSTSSGEGAQGGGTAGGGGGGGSTGSGGQPGTGGAVAPQGGAGGNPAVVCNVVPKLKLTRVATASSPLLVVQPSAAEPIFVIEKEGKIQIVKPGGNLGTEPFADLQRASIQSDGERGLLGLAFHPQYATNGRFFVYFTRRGSDPVATGASQGDIVIAEGKRSANKEVAETTYKSLVVVGHSQNNNHNGGMIAFGKDGKLYAGTGDGGGQNDPFKAGQDSTAALGKMLRIDVDNVDSRDGNMPAPANKHVWATGLRNPWRWSFDRMTGDLYIGDVGQGTWEEVHVVLNADLKPGLNYGWSEMEGKHCFANNCNMTGKLLPAVEYINPPRAMNGQDPGRSVVGGYVYRGTKIPCLVGRYLFADHNSSQVFSFVYTGGKATDEKELTSDLSTAQTPVGGFTGFGEDASGEMYMTTLNGGVYRIDPE